jgi:hypothetical protein
MIKILYEMPYISYVADKVFNLELEKLNSKEIIQLIKDILSSKKFIDKYGDEIELITNKEKQNFIRHLKKDMIFNNMINRKLSDEEKNELNKLLG